MSKDTSAAAIEELNKKDNDTAYYMTDEEHKTAKDSLRDEIVRAQNPINVPELPANPDIETVEFDTPIIRNKLTISEVNINKPKTGALRGLSLSDLLKVDVDTIIKLVPRVSTPPLTEHEVAALDPADFLSISTAVVGFFASKDQRKKARQEAETAKAEASPTA